MKPDVVVTSYYDATVTDPTLSRLASVATVRRMNIAPCNDEKLRNALRGSTAAIISDEPFDDRTFAKLPDLRVLCCDGTGVDHVDLDAATKHGVIVTNAPVVHEACADLTMGLILAVVRRLLVADEGIRSGRWRDRSHYVTPDICGSTLGLLGFGRVAQALSRRAKGFGMKIIAHSRHADHTTQQEYGVQSVGFDELLRQSDILSIHIRLTEGNRELIGSKEISEMKDGAYLINTSRGAVIDENALVLALRTGKLAGAGLDVFKQEPPPMDHPLLQLKNVVVSPHIGSDTRGSFTRVFNCVVDDILLYFNGQMPKHIVNREVWEHRRGI